MNNEQLKEQIEFNVHEDFMHIKPTHIVKILECDYSMYGKPLANVGDKLPAYKYDAGFKVLLSDGRYYYLSTTMKHIEVVGKFVNSQIVKIK